MFYSNNEKELNEAEIFYISEFKDDGYKLYNCTIGGEGGDTTTNNPRRNEILAKRYITLSKIYKTKEFRDNISKATLGKKKKDVSKMKKNKTKEHKENISNAIKKLWENFEYRRKISFSKEISRKERVKSVDIYQELKNSNFSSIF